VLASFTALRLLSTTPPSYDHGSCTRSLSCGVFPLASGVFPCRAPASPSTARFARTFFFLYFTLHAAQVRCALYFTSACTYICYFSSFSVVRHVAFFFSGVGKVFLPPLPSDYSFSFTAAGQLAVFCSQQVLISTTSGTYAARMRRSCPAGTRVLHSSPSHPPGTVTLFDAAIDSQWTWKFETCAISSSPSGVRPVTATLTRGSRTFRSRPRRQLLYHARLV